MYCDKTAQPVASSLDYLVKLLLWPPRLRSQVVDCDSVDGLVGF